MAIFLQFRTKTKRNTFTNPSLFHFFSSSNSNSDEPESPATATSTSTSTSSDDTPSSSYFSNVKKFLKQEQSSPSIFTLTNPSSSSFTASGTSNPTSFKASNIDEIRKHLSQYRRGVSESKPDSTPPSSPSSNPISLEKIYRRNMERKSSESMSVADLRHAKIGGRLGFDAIRESVRSRRQNAQPSGSSTLIGGTALPASVFGKELREKENSGEMKKAFLKTYKHEELGEKLKKLRPPPKGGDWFSLNELKDRLVKLREMDEMESNAKSTSDANPYGYFRDALYTLKDSENQEKKSRLQSLDILSGLGQTPSFMLRPPKEHLVEKYFHPDNMSSEEKLKIELARVRDEFKMSESDCGSFRVQVAQLTTKIKHLSSVLHKKDKHSRKGLIAMVQKRKRLLKYLRRTDWDSYCLVISKLGLRDNPDTKY